MERQAVNPWDWSVPLGYNQGEVITGGTRRLICAGQTAVDAQGAPQHPGDMRGQIALALENLRAVLDAADMGPGDVVRLGVYTTDAGAALAEFDLMGQMFGAAGVAPPMTLLQVSGLALPGLMFEIEATAEV